MTEKGLFRVKPNTDHIHIENEMLKLASVLSGRPVKRHIHLDEQTFSLSVPNEKTRYSAIRFDDISAYQCCDSQTDASLSVVFYKEQRTVCFERKSVRGEPNEYTNAVNECMIALAAYANDDAGFHVNPRYYENLPEYNPVWLGKMIKNITEKKTATILPLVIVTAKSDWTFPLDPGFLAERLTGKAHVLCLSDDDVINRLEKETGKIKKDGVITVIVPWEERVMYYGSDFGTKEELALAVLSGLSSKVKKVDDIPAYNWTQALELWAMREQKVPLEESKSESHDELLHLQDKEIEEWKEKYETLLTKTKVMAAELDAAKKVASETREGIIFRGNEIDYYPDEVKETIIRILEKYVKTEACRSRDIIMDILDNNPIEGNGEKLKNEIKRIFSTDPQINVRAKNSLKRIGFTFEKSEKHCKAIWNNDQRYTVILSKTPSCKRAGDEAASSICNKIGTP